MRAFLTLSLPADPTLARGRSVINVIVPEGRAHFFQQLGYVLATLLLFILLLITVVLATRQRRCGGEPGRQAHGVRGGEASTGRPRQALLPQAMTTLTRSQPRSKGECPAVPRPAGLGPAPLDP